MIIYEIFSNFGIKFISDLKEIILTMVYFSPIIFICIVPSIIYFSIKEKSFKGDGFGIVGYLLTKLVRRIR